MDWLEAFVQESNKIEDIPGFTNAQVDATRTFIYGDLTIPALVELVGVLQPDAELRKRVGMNVRVGNHIPPMGGPDIENRLQHILDRAQTMSPWRTHCAYETLHPFTDGNGRSGRALWLWIMLRREYVDSAMARTLGFLHTFYYQTLENTDRPNG